MNLTCASSPYISLPFALPLSWSKFLVLSAFTQLTMDLQTLTNYYREPMLCGYRYPSSKVRCNSNYVRHPTWVGPPVSMDLCPKHAQELWNLLVIERSRCSFRKLQQCEAITRGIRCTNISGTAHKTLRRFVCPFHLSMIAHDACLFAVTFLRIL
jgi:hypothetical protein